MKQRLGIAAALLTQPELVLLDEPTNGLDPAGMVEVRALIKQLAQRGITVLLASHLLHEVQQVCTRVAIMKEGHLLAQGEVRRSALRPDWSATGFCRSRTARCRRRRRLLQASDRDDTMAAGREDLTPGGWRVGSAWRPDALCGCAARSRRGCQRAAGGTGHLCR